MKKFVLMLALCFIYFAPTELAAIHNAHKPKKSVELTADHSKSKKVQRMEKKLQKMEAKIQKKLDKKKAKLNILEEPKFVLGALLVGGAAGLGLIAALGVLRGLFGWLAGVFAFVGLIFIIWALIEYYS